MRRVLAMVVLAGCGKPGEYPIDGYVQSYVVSASQGPTNVVVALDRTVVTAELAGPLSRFGEQFPGSLMSFPRDGDCAGLVPVDDLAAISPASQRSTAQALIGAANLLFDKPAAGRNFVVLLAGGRDTCGGDALSAVRGLSRNGIWTVVVGYGFLGVDDVAELDALALAGGFPRTCPSGLDSECGTMASRRSGPACDTSTFACVTPSWLTSTPEGLKQIVDALTPELPQCAYAIDGPATTADRVGVFLDYQQTSEWTLLGNVITLTDGACETLRNSTTRQPVRLDIRVVTRP